MKTINTTWKTFLVLVFFAFTVAACDKAENDPAVNEEYYENEESEVEVLLTFENFKKQVKALSIDGFSLMSITAGEDGDKEYEATFKNKAGNYLFIKIGEMFTSEPIWADKENTYMFNERKSEYYTMGYISGVTIFLPQIEAEFGVYATTDLGKEKFENIASATGFLAIDPETVAWPNGIPENYKLDGFLLEAELFDYAETPDFTKQMYAVMMLTDALAQSYKNVCNAYYDDLSDYIVFPDGTYLQVPDENLYNKNDLYKSYSKYQRIEFMYYIP